MAGEALERQLTLMPACWAFFDAVRSRVSSEMQRDPRGGGRDRDHIVRHTLANEQDWANKLGVLTLPDAMLTDEGLSAHRDAYCTAIRALHSQGSMACTWPLRFLMRHTAFRADVEERRKGLGLAHQFLPNNVREIAHRTYQQL
jgi:hypothetical protein